MDLNWFTYQQSLTFLIFLSIAGIAVTYAKSTSGGTLINTLSNIVAYMMVVGVLSVGLKVLFS